MADGKGGRGSGRGATGSVVQANRGRGTVNEQAVGIFPADIQYSVTRRANKIARAVDEGNPVAAMEAIDEAALAAEFSIGEQMDTIAEAWAGLGRPMTRINYTRPGADGPNGHYVPPIVVRARVRGGVWVGTVTTGRATRRLASGIPGGGGVANHIGGLAGETVRENAMWEASLD